MPDSDLENLPVEVTALIMKSLKPRDLANLAQTSTRMKAVVDGPGAKPVRDKILKEEKALAEELKKLTTSMKAAAKVAAKVAKATSQQRLLLSLNEHNPTYAKTLLMHLKSGSGMLKNLNEMQKAVRKAPKDYHPGLVRAATDFKNAKDELKRALGLK